LVLKACAIDKRSIDKRSIDKRSSDKRSSDKRSSDKRSLSELLGMVAEEDAVDLAFNFDGLLSPARPSSFLCSYFVAFFATCFEKLGKISTLRQTSTVCYSVLLNEFKCSNFQKLEYFQQSVFQLRQVFVC
jgi:hypothetical protein